MILLDFLRYDYIDSIILINFAFIILYLIPVVFISWFVATLWLRNHQLYNALKHIGASITLLCLMLSILPMEMM